MAVRMSWFLVEMDEGGQKRYNIIHSLDIIDEQSDLKYINRIVRFYGTNTIMEGKNGANTIMEGKVMFACDDNVLVEQHLKTLTSRKREVKVNPDAAKHFLVQYNKDTDTVVHKILHQEEIILPKDESENSVKEVLMEDDKIRRIATVLHVNDSEELIEKELEKLKTICLDKVFKSSNDNAKITETPWLLVQYCNDLFSILYSIVHIDSTVSRDENLFPHVVAYLLQDDVIFQATILRTSHNRDELVEELRSIKDTSMALQITES